MIPQYSSFLTQRNMDLYLLSPCALPTSALVFGYMSPKLLGYAFRHLKTSSLVLSTFLGFEDSGMLGCRWFYVSYLGSTVGCVSCS